MPGNNPTHEQDIVTEYVYDALGNRVVITNALGYTGSLTLYDSLNRPIVITDALGYASYNSYNVLGQQLVVTDANEAVTWYAYDNLNRLVTTTYVDDQETVTYTYNADGQRMSMQDSLGTTHYLYDDFSRLISVTNPFTGTILYTYDSVGNRTHLTYPDGKVVTTTYDADARMIEVVDWDEGLTSYGYDAIGRLITTTIPNGVTSVNQYDNADNLVELTYIDSNNNLLSQYEYGLDSLGNRVVATETMLALGPHQLLTQTAVTANSSNEDRPTITYNPDDKEYLIVWQDDNTLPLSVWGRRLDSDGNVLGSSFFIATGINPTVAYSNADRSYLVVWENGEDIQARPVMANGTPGTTFDVDNNVPFTTNSHPAVVYSQHHETFLITWEGTTSSLIQPSYEIILARTATANGTSGSIITVAQQTTGLDWPQLSANDTGQFLIVWQDERNSSWDIYGQRLNDSALIGSNFIVSNTNDEEFWPDVAWSSEVSAYLTVWQDDNWTVWGQRIDGDGDLLGAAIELGYPEDVGYPKVIAIGDKWQIVWASNGPGTWGLVGHVVGQEVAADGSLLDLPMTLSGMFDEVSRVALTGDEDYLVVWAGSPYSGGGNSFAPANLDIYNRLARQMMEVQSTVVAYEYDPLGRMTEADHSGVFNGNYQYAFDALGNRTAYTTTITTTSIITYQYDSANRLLQSAEVGGEMTSYEWDNAGRLITTTAGLNVTRVYTYSQNGDLTAALVDNLLTTFVYDGDGRRLQMSVAGELVTYTLDYAGGGRVLLEEGGAFSGTKHYLYGLECIAELVDADEPESEEWRYYHQDGNQLVRQTTNMQATITFAWTYSPEGAVLLGEEGPVTNLGCGAIYDWSTGLIFKQSRYFDPNTGIWITLSGMVVWNGWQTSVNNRNRKRQRRKRLLLLLLLFLVIITLAGCGGNIPAGTPIPDPTETCTPTNIPIPMPTLPPPIAKSATLTPTATSTTRPTTTPTNTPSPTNTPVPPTPTMIPTMDSLTLANPFGVGNKFLGVNGFGSSLGAQESLGGDQGVGHAGIDIVPLNYALESKRNNYVPTQNHRDLYAPTSGIVRRDVANHKIVIETVVQEGMIYVELIHVNPSEGPPDGSNVQAGAPLFMKFKGSGHGYGSENPHLHIGFYIKDNRGEVYHDPRSKLLTPPDYAGSYWGFKDPADGSYFTQLPKGA